MLRVDIVKVVGGAIGINMVNNKGIQKRLVFHDAISFLVMVQENTAQILALDAPQSGIMSLQHIHGIDMVTTEIPQHPQ